MSHRWPARLLQKLHKTESVSKRPTIVHSRRENGAALGRREALEQHTLYATFQHTRKVVASRPTSVPGTRWLRSWSTYPPGLMKPACFLLTTLVRLHCVHWTSWQTTDVIEVLSWMPVTRASAQTLDEWINAQVHA